MNTPKIEGIVRHILTLLGGVAVALGWISEDVLAEGTAIVVGLVGAVLAAIAFVRSFLAPEKQITASEYQALKAKSK